MQVSDGEVRDSGPTTCMYSGVTTRTRMGKGRMGWRGGGRGRRGVRHQCALAVGSGNGCESTLICWASLNVVSRSF